MPMEKRLSASGSKKIIINGISLLLAVIDITLVVNRSRFFYEMLIAVSGYGIFQSPKMVLLLMAVFWLTGAFVFYKLIDRLCVRRIKG